METKTILVTGAGGALGLATVKELTAAHYHTIAVIRPGKNQPEYDHTNFEEADLTNDEDVGRLVSRVFEKHKAIDAIVMLAGGYSPGGLEKTGNQELARMFATNFETAYYLTRHTLPRVMKQPAGCRFIFIGSRAALEPDAANGAIAYSLSKSLLFRLSEIVNAKGGRQNIVSTVIVPGIIDTEQNRKSMPKADHSEWVVPGEIAAMIRFLCSGEGRSVRNSVIKMYGNG